MTEQSTPWYVQWVVGLGAWITALVLTALGGAFIFALLEIDTPGALAVFGIGYAAMGGALLRSENDSVFVQQLGLATAAAGTALIVGGIAAEAESLWIGFIVSLALLAGVVHIANNRTLQFLVAAMALAYFGAALVDVKASYLLDIAAVATPIGMYLYLRPPKIDLAPTSIALLLAFPVATLYFVEDVYWLRNVDLGGTLAKILHILLFLGLAWLHWTNVRSRQGQILGFAVVATAVCVILPPGGSAAMLLLMLAFVVGSRPFAVVGAALQAQWLVRYYYSLEMDLLNKSILLMAVGLLLLVAWWLANRSDRVEAGS